MILAAALLAYHIDLTRIFASPEAEKADRQVLARDIDSLQRLRGKVPSHLAEALQLNDAVQIRLARHDIYLYLRYAMDTENPDESSALDAEVAAKTAFLNQDILRMPSVPKIAGREFEIESIRRWRKHTLPEAGEEVLADAAPLATQWQYDLSQKTTDRDLVAFALTRLASSRNAIAHIRRFHDAAESAYFRSFWTREQVRALLKELEANAETYKRYEQLRAKLPQPAAPKFTIEDARRILLEATAPLGPDYARELAALLDPANGRMDILPGPHRYRGGFSQGATGTDSVFFSGGFTGTYNDVRVLMHESTHAVQRQLMNAAHVPVAYTSGPHFLAEALAMFNELVLADYMAANASDPAMRQFYLRQFLDGKGMIAFVVAPEAELEEDVYDGVAAGTIRNADDLDQLTARVYQKFTISPDPKRWMSVRLMYEDPFYDVNYVAGGIVALRMYAMYARDPAAFAAKYVAMMKNGYTAPPNELLKQFFGFDQNDPIGPVIALLNDRVAHLVATPLTRPSATLSLHAGRGILTRENPSPRVRGEGGRRPDEGQLALLNDRVAGFVAQTLLSVHRQESCATQAPRPAPRPPASRGEGL